MRENRMIPAMLAVGIGLVAAGSGLPVRAQDLVINGEKIADAATMAAAKKEGKVVVYGAFPARPMKALLNAFKKDTGIPFDHVRLTTEKLYPRVTAEYAAGRLAADYVDLTDLTLVKQLVTKGILNHPHKVPAFDRINSRLKDPQGRWYALLRPVSVLAVNSALVKQADYPKSLKDVLDPKWKGKIGMPSIDAGGSAFTLYTFLREVMGEGYWAKLAAQKPRIYPAVSPTVTDLVRGETSIAFAGAPPVLGSIRSGAPLKIVFAKEGISGFPVSGGITSVAKHPNAAAVLLNWMTSKRGGNSIIRFGAYAANPDARSPKPSSIAFPPASKVWNIDVDIWAKVRVPYSQEWRKTFGTN